MGEPITPREIGLFFMVLLLSAYLKISHQSHQQFKRPPLSTYIAKHVGQDSSSYE